MEYENMSKRILLSAIPGPRELVDGIDLYDIMDEQHFHHSTNIDRHIRVFLHQHSH